MVCTLEVKLLKNFKYNVQWEKIFTFYKLEEKLQQLWLPLFSKPYELQALLGLVRRYIVYLLRLKLLIRVITGWELTGGAGARGVAGKGRRTVGNRAPTGHAGRGGAGRRGLCGDWPRGGGGARAAAGLSSRRPGQIRRTPGSCPRPALQREPQ